jgi:cell division protease FtsH
MTKSKQVRKPRKSYSEADSVDPENMLCKARDPALMVAHEILRHALAVIPDYEQTLSRPGTFIVVRTPSADWTNVIRDAWREIIQRGLPSVDGARTGWWTHETWACLTIADEDARQRRFATDQTDMVEEAAWRGKSLVGFAPDPFLLLPKDLLIAADHVFVVREPTMENLEKTLLVLAGPRSFANLTPDRLKRVRPTLLRLARRLDQSADEFMVKLNTLLDAEEMQDESQSARRCSPPSKRRPLREEPTLDRLHGMDEAVTWGRSLQISLQEHAAGRLPWSDVESGCMLSGPPGCGKTIFARALAATCSIPLFVGGYSVWSASGRGTQGDLLKGLRATFADAKSAKPSIVFIDELDTFRVRRSKTEHQQWNSEVVNALLEEIDGVEGREGVVILGASNYPQWVDPALVRSGRIEREICISTPDRAALAKIFREHLNEDLPDAPLAALALNAAGATGSDCESFVRVARRLAREAKRPLQHCDLLAAIRGGENRSEQALRIVSVHEAGHTLVIQELFPGTFMAVTIREGGDGAGRVLSKISGSFERAESVRLELACLLAGRAAEEVIFGAPSSAAGGELESDLGTATWLATRSAASYGLDETTGLLWAGASRRNEVQDMLAANPKLANRVNGILDAAYQVALQLIRRRTDDLNALSEALLERWALDSADVAKILTTHFHQRIAGEKTRTNSG